MHHHHYQTCLIVQVMSRFYERLSGINEYYKRFPNEMYDPAKDKSMEADRTRIGTDDGGGDDDSACTVHR